MMQPRVMERHFLDLRKKYGTVLAIDLVNKVNIISLHYDFSENGDLMVEVIT